MKFLILFAICLSNLPVSAQHIVVFGKEDICTIAAQACIRTKLPDQKFADRYQASLQAGLGQRVERKMITPPLEWGRKVSDQTYGTLRHLENFSGGLVTRLELFDMRPNHNYRLCLNGRPDLVGNSLLPTPVRGNEKEKYFDFLTVTTDEKGEYHADFAIMLAPGDYHVRMYIKDTDDFKILLYHDYFKFRVDVLE